MTMHAYMWYILMCMQMSADGTHAITASLDKTARLIDVESFEVLRTYKTGKFVQSAAMSPIFDHVSDGRRRGGRGARGVKGSEREG